MAISDKKKISNANWDKKNMATLGCRVKKDEADTFKKYAISKNVTANTLLKEYVIQCNYEYLKQQRYTDDGQAEDK